MPAHHEGGEDERRNQILDAAGAVFARLGFTTARMDDIVTASGLSKGTLYWYYTSKDDIIQGILRRLFAGELKRLQHVETAAGSVSERLMRYVQHYAQTLQRLQWLMPLTLDFYAMSSRHAWARTFLREYYAEYRAVVETLIAQGITSGEFQTVPLADAAMMVISLIEGITLLWLIDGEPVTLEQRGLFSAQLVLSGLRVRREILSISPEE